jgi:hypothetical protein
MVIAYLQDTKLSEIAHAEKIEWYFDVESSAARAEADVPILLRNASAFYFILCSV